MSVNLESNSWSANFSQKKERTNLFWLLFYSSRETNQTRPFINLESNSWSANFSQKKERTNLFWLLFYSSRETNQTHPFIFLEKLRLANPVFGFIWPLENLQWALMDQRGGLNANFTLWAIIAHTTFPFIRTKHKISLFNIWTVFIYSIKQNDEIRNFQWAASASLSQSR